MGEYTIVVGNPWDEKDFIEDVNRKIEQGWQPHGPPAIDGSSADRSLIVQAMIRLTLPTNA